MRLVTCVNNLDYFFSLILFLFGKNLVSLFIPKHSQTAVGYLLYLRPSLFLKSFDFSIQRAPANQ